VNPTPGPGWVLDASALLALLQNERGGAVVEPLLDQAAISSVNWSEVLQKSLSRGIVVDQLGDELGALGLLVVPFNSEDAVRAAHLWDTTRHLGLSLADRACLALGLRFQAPVLTADRSWTMLALGVEIQSIR